MSIAIESRIEAAWWAKQTAQGSPAATADKRGRKIGGDMNPNVDHGSINYSPGERFSAAEDYVTTILGNGNPTIMGQPGPLGHLAYLMLGQETVTQPVTGVYDHESTPNNAGSFWSTWWKRVGEAVGPVRQRFDDCRFTSLRYEGSSASRVVQAVATWISLDPAVAFATDPVKTEDSDRAILFTEGEGRFKINGSVFRGNSSFAFTINDAVTPWYGDGTKPHAVVYGAGTVDLEGITILVDQQGKEYYDELIYGSANPAAGTKPRSDVPVLGSYEIDLRRGGHITFTAPGSGTYTLTVGGQVTAAIAFGANAAAVQAAIEALPNIAVGDVVVSGTAPNLVIVFPLRSGIVVTASTGTVVDNGHYRGFKAEFSNVKWTPDLAIAGNPDGGAVELALAAQTRKDPDGSDPHVKVTTRSGDAAYS